MGKNIRDLMTQNPRAVRPDDSVVDAARVLRDENVGSLPVTDGDRLVGMITDRDITLRVVAEARDPGSVSVQEVASPNPVTAESTVDLDDALQLMGRHQVRRLPVTEEGRLVGILAQADVASQVGEKETGRLVEAISEPSAGARRETPQCGVQGRPPRTPPPASVSLPGELGAGSGAAVTRIVYTALLRSIRV